MVPESYVVYESEKAMNDFYNAMLLAPVSLKNTHYISEEIAVANLEVAILYYKAYHSATKS